MELCQRMIRALTTLAPVALEIDEDGKSGLIVAREFVSKDMAERHAMIRRALRSPGSEVTADEARQSILFALTPAEYAAKQSNDAQDSGTERPGRRRILLNPKSIRPSSKPAAGGLRRKSHSRTNGKSRQK